MNLQVFHHANALQKRKTSRNRISIFESNLYAGNLSSVTVARLNGGENANVMNSIDMRVTVNDWFTLFFREICN